MKPIIGIVPSFIEQNTEKYYKLFKNYCDCIRDREGIPIIIPIIDMVEIDVILKLIDGLLLSGGSDICPSFYKEKVMIQNLLVSKQRDQFEINLTKKALLRNVPVLGICRGMQLLNVAAGGTLYQDINQYNLTSFNHKVNGEEENYGTHYVRLVKDKLLFKIFQTDCLKVNSIHHQAVAELAEGFCANAHAEDGIIEGIENLDYLLALGVQWHPERMIKAFSKHYKLFDLLIEKAIENRKSKGGEL